jgi:hypothetical protein
MYWLVTPPQDILYSENLMRLYNTPPGVINEFTKLAFCASEINGYCKSNLIYFLQIKKWRFV